MVGHRISALLDGPASVLVPALIHGSIVELGRGMPLLQVAGSDRSAKALLCRGSDGSGPFVVGYESIQRMRFLLSDEVEERLARLERRLTARSGWPRTQVARSLAFHGVPAEEIAHAADAIILLEAMDTVALGLCPHEGLMQDVFDVCARLPALADLWAEMLLDWLEVIELANGPWPTGRVAAAYFWRLLGEAEATLETLEGSDDPAPLWTEAMGTAVAANAWLDLFERTGRRECLSAALERADRVMGLMPPDGPAEWVEEETRTLALRLSRLVPGQA